MNTAVLTFLGVVFDKIHFPNVHLPTVGFDMNEALAEAERIAKLGIRNHDTAIVVGILRFLPYVRDLEGFCHFASVPNQIFGATDKSVNEIVSALDEAIHGPPADGFYPSYMSGHHKALPGNEKSINYPGALHYPSNALVYAARHDLPIVNDDLSLPIPSLGGIDAKHNAKLLTTILALECASLVLPKIKALPPKELMEMREELGQYMRPFRLSLLNLSKELNKAIESTATGEEIQAAAKFIVDTEVYPKVLELKDVLESPDKRWYNRAFDVAKQVPELATSFATLPTADAITKALTAVGGVLVDVHQTSKKSAAKRTGFYYLLKLSKLSDE